MSTSIESPLIGSGSQEEVDLRVAALIGLGKSRGFLTYEELNEKLPDEVVSPDKLDTLLMQIDEMGIKLIDEHDIGDYVTQPKPAPRPREARDGGKDGKDGKDARHGGGGRKGEKPAAEDEADVIRDENGE